MNKIGIDGGGTGSRMQLVKENCAPQIWESGPLNWSTTPREVFWSNLDRLLSHAPTGSSICACLAGILSDEDALAVSKYIQSHVKDASVSVKPDFCASWRACDNPDAISVISGTGSLICSKFSNQMVKSGGGGFLLGDFGSGTAFGKHLLACLISRKTVPDSAIESINRFFETSDVNQMVKFIYMQSSPASILAKLASLVLGETGSEMSTIVDEVMLPLSAIVLRHAEETGNPNCSGRVYCNGGFWKASPLIKESFDRHLKTLSFEPKMTSLEGAVLLASEI